MIVTFDTEYGLIECDRKISTAYFHADDYECSIFDGTFHDLWGRRFDVLWPSSFGPKWNEAILKVWQPHEIGRALPS
jgi:hypothetical protein